MPVFITNHRQSVTPVSPSEKKRSGHTKPRAPLISLNEPGRLRVAHVLSLLAVSHSTLYEGIKTLRYPPPDGYDGKMPFWKTATINQFLEV